jgi:cell wall-associated NlpC family hydrolase
MHLSDVFRRGVAVACVLAALPFSALADESEPAAAKPESTSSLLPSLSSFNPVGDLGLRFDSLGASALYQRAQSSVQDAVDQAMVMLGIPYRLGGAKPEAGFDCSGFVAHVFNEGVGLILPRTSRELSKAGDTVDRNHLKPGDLVFFNTMRRAFSHVGIYLGNGQFIHAPRSGARVRVEDLSDSYWKKRYNGARRVDVK